MPLLNSLVMYNLGDQSA